ncbi:glutamate/aspartate transport system substrate-binding protein [Cupriavidus metallidurans]|jgi:glutamate/aspartate transport system substrate-binding protein|uniref:Glutamate/aspartate ABC transporter substrate-binding protein n=1 Tax=Cupriavidus metallidurans TaxID=119219 RepID=A0A132HIF4_9BURK|nr:MULTISPECIES: glutamate/aspartate ABC transporter substrate-binding protein [Cupriavidus]PCH56121.1 MAG: amino acid ABC transporter substrate-binding protein [Burkholderiaceae bacterium]HBD32353.1 amino acid ABC transporter substrate-binding protein [Cupriavidus sp.]KWR83643.1 ABC transporter [Cupriavidus sp. SHE]KWW35989.1 Glutamate/aspartate periplasmic-binding protein [Cupriavidus metallidurans]MDE4916649.1 glutamate/aspartate ABC transporter substrate-binding protein [Cupriavidus metall
MNQFFMTRAAVLMAVSLGAGSALAVDVAASPTLSKIKSSGTISIGHRTSSIPFSYYDANQKVIGFSQDICDRVIDAVKKETGTPNLQVRMVPVTSQNRQSLVQNGTVDLECGVTTNLKSRQQQVAFSTTFFVAGTRLLVKKGSPVHDFGDLSGKAVVTNAGTTSERILRKLNDEKGANITIQSAKDYGESFLILQSGRVAAFMMDDVLLSGSRTLAPNPNDWVVVGTPQSFEAYGFMMRKDDPGFKQVVDATMTGLMRSGEINTLYTKWFLKPVPPKNLSFDLPQSEQIKKAYANPNDEAFE